ncbi:tail fiber domain-containing protein [Candidatus Dojkabacteria bacterium]|jgi:hypothetical protein|nr:tail fiber domain-containing protein [Candidatus Dojkabacteria bacterium]
MSISQITTGNTFGQWLAGTQALIEKWNLVENTANSTYITANNVYMTSNSVNSKTTLVLSTSNNVANISNTVNTVSSIVYMTSNSVNMYSNSVNTTSNNIFAYVGSSYNVANTVLVLATSAFGQANASYTRSNLSYNTANSGYGQANAAYLRANAAFGQANGAFNTSNIVFSRSNSAFTHANSAFDKANGSFDKANGAYNTVNTVYEIANSIDFLSITDYNSLDAERYVTFTSNSSGVLLEVGVSSSKLLFNPLSGTLTIPVLNTFSDINLKNNIQEITNSIDILNKINGVSFNWKDNGRKSYGIIAQELEQILPDLVEGRDIKTVNYIGLIAFLINAVKDLNSRLSLLEKYYVN